jgi:hypothetical protein
MAAGACAPQEDASSAGVERRPRTEKELELEQRRLSAPVRQAKNMEGANVACLSFRNRWPSASSNPLACFPWMRSIILKRILICPQGALTPYQYPTSMRRWIVWYGACTWDALPGIRPSQTRPHTRAGGTLEFGPATKQGRGFRNWRESMASPSSVCGRSSGADNAR